MVLLPPEQEMPEIIEKKHGKFQKPYSKPCSVCYGEQEVYQYSEELDGVKYDRHYIECLDCGNKIELKKDHHKVNNFTKYDW